MCEQATVHSTAIQVFDTTELLENILLNLDTRTLLATQRVSKTFSATIIGSIHLRRALFLAETPSAPVDSRNDLVFSAITTNFPHQNSRFNVCQDPLNSGITFMFWGSFPHSSLPMIGSWRQMRTHSGTQHIQHVKVQHVDSDSGKIATYGRDCDLKGATFGKLLDLVMEAKELGLPNQTREECLFVPPRGACWCENTG